jgi:hypothetical protein
MKKPRIDAFLTPDKAKTLASPLDGMPTIRPPSPPRTPDASAFPAAADSTPIDDAREHATVGVPPYPRTPVPLPRRVIVQRRPFDIYADQYGRLKEIAREETSSGGNGSMSRMVREAIDAYLAAHDKQQKKR